MNLRASFPIGTLVLLLAAPAAGEPGPGRAARTWHSIQKLRTTGSVLHITAHPDDEYAGLLALLSRGLGVRTTLLSLTRGEAGANAIGSELFDGLGWIRAAELTVAGEWYGLDRIYFTPLADYGYSRSLAEALRAWDEDEALADVVEVVRRERPMVILARFTGDPRDGHGQHQFAGMIAARARDGAPDLEAFPPREGRRGFLRPALFLPAREGEAGFPVDLTGGRPWLDPSFRDIGAIGLSLQRSQTGGVVRATGRESVSLRPAPPGGETVNLLELLGPERASLAARFGGVVPARLGAILEDVDERFRRVAAAFDWMQPEASVPALGSALAAVRSLLGERSPSGFFDVRHELERKEAQLLEAIRHAAGVDLEATARLPGVGNGSRPLPPVVPGQEFAVEVRGRAGFPAEVLALELGAPEGTDLAGEPPEILENVHGPGVFRRFRVRLAVDAPVLEPHVVRSGPGESRYRTRGDWTLAAPPPAFRASATIRIPAGGGDAVEAIYTVPVERIESNLPFGNERRELEILPPVSLAFTPAFAVSPTEAPDRAIEVHLLATGHAPGAFRVSLETPAGWSFEPAEREVRFGRAGESVRISFRVRPAGGGRNAHRVRATLLGPGGAFEPAASHERIEHRGLPLRYLVRPAAIRVASAPVTVPAGLRVGYVTGVGDDVPAGIKALGATVDLLDGAALAAADLVGYDAIVTGTRAYAVRPDLVRANQRLLEYAEAGGHLVVLYNTAEMVPAEHAPYPGVLPANAEEITEEDSEVTFLAPDHPLLTWPNRIGPADFEGWVEQRGSKFWSEWDPAYTPLFETADEGQAPQRGGALTAEVGRGRYTWFAFALHRQLGQASPGAFRLLANLISASRAP